MAKGLLEKAIDSVQKRDRQNTRAGQTTGGTSGKRTNSGTSKKLDETKPTAKSPAGVQKSKEQGQKEREALRKKQQERNKKRS